MTQHPARVRARVRGRRATLATGRHKRAPRNTRDWKTEFLKGFKATGSVAGGCDRAGVVRSTAYRARHRDEAFALKWADVDAEVTDRLEATALLLAMRGSERLIEFLLKARRPEMYREHHQVELAGPGGGPVELDALGDLSQLSDRDLSSLQRILRRTHADG